MTTDSWNWRGKDGGGGGLLYESGNWGDLLKMQWLTAVLAWKRQFDAPINYLDTFAGDVDYPLGRRLLFRIEQTDLTELDFLKKPFLELGRWPSSASAARLLTAGRVEVYDVDPGRRQSWERVSGIDVLSGDSGWKILDRRGADPDEVWLVDPYDFLAEWRAYLPLLVEKAETATLLLYVYNRSAKNGEAFREYRAFRNALDDARGELPKRVGRIAADAFLPRSHHEMVFLPGATDRDRPELDGFMRELAARTARVNAGLAAASWLDV